MSEYLIQKSTLDEIASQSMSLVGKTEAVSTAEIIDDLTDVNNEVGSQAELISQIASVLEGKAGGSEKIYYMNIHVSTIIDNAFYDFSNLTTVSFPACTSIGSSAFAYCSSLTSVYFSACTSIGSQAFEYCYRLATASFPACTHIGDYAFYSCRNLTTASFPVCTSIGSSAFNKCRTLSSITLGASTVCTLTDSNAFSSTPYAGYKSYFSGTPYIYVPSSLVDSYKTATNWTYFSSYIVGYVNEGTSELIDFTLGSTVYQAEEGMTWRQWVESKYNTLGGHINANNDWEYYGMYIRLKLSNDGDYINMNDKIIKNITYSMSISQS